MDQFVTFRKRVYKENIDVYFTKTGNFQIAIKTLS